MIGAALGALVCIFFAAISCVNIGAPRAFLGRWAISGETFPVINEAKFYIVNATKNIFIFDIAPIVKPLIKSISEPSAITRTGIKNPFAINGDDKTIRLWGNCHSAEINVLMRSFFRQTFFIRGVYSSESPHMNVSVYIISRGLSAVFYLNSSCIIFPVDESWDFWNYINVGPQLKLVGKQLLTNGYFGPVEKNIAYDCCYNQSCGSDRVSFRPWVSSNTLGVIIIACAIFVAAFGVLDFIRHARFTLYVIALIIAGILSGIGAMLIPLG